MCCATHVRPRIEARAGVIVELVGRPGSGKTSTARAALALLQERGLAVVPFAELDAYQSTRGERFLIRCNILLRAFHFARFYRRQLRFLLGVWWLTLRHGGLSPGHWRKARRPLASLLVACRLAADFPGRGILIHDGFVQKLWSTLIESRALRDRERIAALLASYYQLTGIRCIVLQAPAEVVTERIFSRDSKGRFNRHSPPRRRQEFARWLGYHDAITGSLPAAAVLGEIDATLAPDAVAEQVARLIASASAAQPPTSDS